MPLTASSIPTSSRQQKRASNMYDYFYNYGTTLVSEDYLNTIKSENKKLKVELNNLKESSKSWQNEYYKKNEELAKERSSWSSLTYKKNIEVAELKKKISELQLAVQKQYPYREYEKEILMKDTQIAILKKELDDARKLGRELGTDLKLMRIDSDYLTKELSRVHDKLKKH